MGYKTQVKQLSDFYDAYGLEAGTDEGEEMDEDEDDDDDDDGSDDDSEGSGDEMSVDGK